VGGLRFSTLQAICPFSTPESGQIPFNHHNCSAGLSPPSPAAFLTRLFSAASLGRGPNKYPRPTVDITFSANYRCFRRERIGRERCLAWRNALGRNVPIDSTKLLSKITAKRQCGKKKLNTGSPPSIAKNKLRFIMSESRSSRLMAPSSRRKQTKPQSILKERPNTC